MNRMPALPAKNSQSGAALVTVLVLLLVMTFLGVISIRATLLEERMSANLYDRSVAFQAAEAALRAGEDAAAALGPTGIDEDAACSDGLCGFPVTDAAPVWESQTVWDAAPATTVDFEDRVISAPKYIVELLATEVPARATCTTSGDVSETSCSGSERRYRITARSSDDDRASVTLQSIYAVP